MSFSLLFPSGSPPSLNSLADSFTVIFFSLFFTKAVFFLLSLSSLLRRPEELSGVGGAGLSSLSLFFSLTCSFTLHCVLCSNNCREKYSALTNFSSASPFFCLLSFTLSFRWRKKAAEQRRLVARLPCLSLPQFLFFFAVCVHCFVLCESERKIACVALLVGDSARRRRRLLLADVCVSF